VELVLTPAIEGMTGAVHAAQQLVRKKKYVMLGQFENPANPEVHRRTTAREILEATDGRIDAFVAGVGTGGTITGVGEVLKEAVPGVLNRDSYDEIIEVKDEDALKMTSRLTREEGLLVGISSGANAWAAAKVAQKLGAGKRVVTMLCDTGERYLSVSL
jgi:cysteine synthase A